jgi:hypothetical protein
MMSLTTVSGARAPELFLGAQGGLRIGYPDQLGDVQGAPFSMELPNSIQSLTEMILATELDGSDKSLGMQKHSQTMLRLPLPWERMPKSERETRERLSAFDATLPQSFMDQAAEQPFYSMGIESTWFWMPRIDGVSLSTSNDLLFPQALAGYIAFLLGLLTHDPLEGPPRDRGG